MSSSAPRSSAVSAYPSPSAIPPLYTLLFLYLEPTFALLGTIQILLSPLTTFSIDHPHMHARLVSLSAINPSLLPTLQPIFTLIAGGWLVLLLNDFILLRRFRNRGATGREVWRVVLALHLVSDVVYLGSLVGDVRLGLLDRGLVGDGGIEGWWRAFLMFWNPTRWGRGEWLTNVLTLPFTVGKVAFLCGCGVGA